MKNAGLKVINVSKFCCFLYGKQVMQFSNKNDFDHTRYSVSNFYVMQFHIHCINPLLNFLVQVLVATG
jgi:hypothetical protein